ncbi:xanthine dehydrogenase family protein molybdopterin-binding subunit [Streptomyces sp. NPDC058665]|uniref:xanthine dehydrogenase family protein molybdopterin-binding subunit n=1 Tax=Streptomyces sp. NPDC058665 TaxID=3346586 RepID=UPI003658DE3C
MSNAVGKPVSRVDGRRKVTGAARYTAEIELPNLVHAAVVGAGIPSGRVLAIDEKRVRDEDGVLAVLTHDNLTRIASQPPLLPSLVGGAAPGETFFPMQDDTVHYAGQPVAIVVADSHERAQYAASLLDITYERADSVTTIEEGRAAAYEAATLFGGLMPGRNERGDVETALAQAPVRVDVDHHYAANHHNTLEPSATTAVWDGERLTLYDSTMGVRATQLTVAQLLGIPIAHIRVITEFVGGGFGGKAMTWPHVTLAAMAARHVRRPVRLALTRPQTYTSHGHREEQEQRLSIGAAKDGRITAVRHEKLSVTSPFDDWAEPATGVTSQLYTCENYLGVHRLIRGNIMTPTFMRAPGESLGVSTLEVAMDKLAYATGVDPVELRLRNRASVDEHGHPWSSDGLEECLRTGARLFGWERRDPEPRSRREGDWLIGSGMAVAAYPMAFMMPPQQARVRIYADGSAVMQCGTQEFGTGGTTAMTQVAADGLGMDMSDVTFEAGDSDLPNASASVGSMGASMVSAAVHNAAVELRRQLIAMAVADGGSPLHGADPSAVVVQDGRMSLGNGSGAGETYAEMMGRNHLSMMDALGDWTPPPMDTPHGLMTFGAQFAEVAVDPDFGLVRVRRMVGVFAPGRVLNPKLARSQLMGGMLWGMSQALLEGNQMDPRYGRWGAGNLGEYLVPVNADAPDVTVEFVDVTDDVAGPLGVKGVGEIGQVGMAAAMMNAVFHATGRRPESLPMAAELVMDPMDPMGPPGTPA